MLQTLTTAFRWLFHTTLPAGRLLGIPLRVHLLLVIMLCVFIPMIVIESLDSPSPWIEMGFGFAFIAVCYVSILAHEFGHAWGFRLVGGRTDTIILTPVGGLAVGLGAGLSPRAELLVTALGPAVSILLAVIGHIGVWLLPPPDFWNGVQAIDLLAGLAYIVAYFNTLISIFNLLLPLFPMDCARLIRASLSLKYNPGAVTYRLCQLGIGLGIFLIAAMFLRLDIPFYGRIGPWLGIIGLLGINSCLYEMQRIRYSPVYDKSDQWGSRTVFYDKDEMAMAKTRAFEDLGSLLKRKPSAAARKKRPRRSGPAKIIDIADVHDPEHINDLGRLQVMMKDAADQENFPLAARIQKRIKEIKAREQREGS